MSMQLKDAMIENETIGATEVTGPLGYPLTLESLPSGRNTRWVARRKAEIVAAVDGGLLTVSDACDRYNLTIEEFVSWQRSMERSGMKGLRATRVQAYRQRYEREQKRSADQAYR